MANFYSVSVKSGGSSSGSEEAPCDRATAAASGCQDFLAFLQARPSVFIVCLMCRYFCLFLLFATILVRATAVCTSTTGREGIGATVREPGCTMSRERPRACHLSRALQTPFQKGRVHSSTHVSRRWPGCLSARRSTRCQHT